MNKQQNNNNEKNQEELTELLDSFEQNIEYFNFRSQNNLNDSESSNFAQNVITMLNSLSENERRDVNHQLVQQVSQANEQINRLMQILNRAQVRNNFAQSFMFATRSVQSCRPSNLQFGK